MRLPEAISMKLAAHTDNIKRKNGYKDSLPTEKNSHNLQCNCQDRFMVLLKEILGSMCILTHTSEALRVKQPLRSELQVFTEPHVDTNLNRDPITTHHKIRKKENC